MHYRIRRENSLPRATSTLCGESFKQLGAVLGNFIVPGAGFIAVGKYRQGLAIQAFLASSVIVLCWTRWILTPAGCKALLILIALTYCINTLFLIVHTKKDRPVWAWKNALFALIFSGVFISALIIGFKTKDRWLGVHIYFVPSMSMHPALKPGQFILLDTWIYQSRTPQQDDIVVFQHHSAEQWLVKRIARWPSGELQQNGLWYVLGDNRNASQDSRYFGGVHREKLVGQVKLVLLEIDQQHQLQEQGFLIPVN